MQTIFSEANMCHFQNAINMTESSLQNLKKIVKLKESRLENWHEEFQNYKPSLKFVNSNLRNDVTSISQNLEYSLEKKEHFHEYKVYKILAFLQYKQIKPTESNINPTYKVENRSSKGRYFMLRMDECFLDNYKRAIWNPDFRGKLENIRSNVINMTRSYGYCCIKQDDEVAKIQHLYKIINKMKEFYELLHTFVKQGLKKNYNLSDSDFPGGRIPIHLTGDLWGSDWTNFDSNDNFEKDINTLIQDKSMSLLDLAQTTLAYFDDLNFPKLPYSFYNKSIFQTKNKCNLSVKDPVTYNMLNCRDYRLTLCADPTYSTWFTIYHQIGHIVYYDAFSKLPLTMQHPMSLEFEEAVGEVIALSALNLENLKRMNLLPQGKDLRKRFLLHQALRDIPKMMYFLTLEIWKYKLIEGQTDSTKLNELWWQYVGEIQGLEMPREIKKDVKDFFTLGLNHFIVSNANIPKYLNAIVLKYQIFEGLCDKSIDEINMELSQCDLFDNKVAGGLLRSIMEKGRGIEWHEGLKILTKRDYIDFKSIFNYYKPLIQYLKKNLNETKFDWKIKSIL
ncbi:unnamed protein product [Gordionus sp. m RMFG-2023]